MAMELQQQITPKATPDDVFTLWCKLLVPFLFPEAEVLFHQLCWTSISFAPMAGILTSEIFHPYRSFGKIIDLYRINNLFVSSPKFAWVTSNEVNLMMLGGLTLCLNVRFPTEISVLHLVRSQQTWKTWLYWNFFYFDVFCFYWFVVEDQKIVFTLL